MDNMDHFANESDNNDDCLVCGAPSRGKEKNYLHYGALACLSCKAFFRRTHREEAVFGKFKCKTGGTCDVNIKNRTKCKQCRYMRCIQAGMDPKLILLDEESRKKYSHPKKKKKPLRSAQGHQNAPCSNHIIQSTALAPLDTGSGTAEIIGKGHSHVLALRFNPPLFHGRDENKTEDLNNMYTEEETFMMKDTTHDYSESAMNIVRSPIVDHPLVARSLQAGDQHWLKNQLDLVDEVFLKIHPNTEMIEEMKLSSHPERKLKFSPAKFNRMSMMLNRARFETMIRLHPELQVLSNHDIEVLLDRNYERARFLLFSRIHTRTSFLEQINIMVGFDGKRQPLQPIAGIPGDLPPMDIQKLVLSHFAPEDRAHFSRLYRQVGYFTDDPEVFKLFTLILLLDSSVSKKVKDLQGHYFNLMVNKIANYLMHAKEPLEDCDLDDDYNEARNGIRNDIVQCCSTVMLNTQDLVNIMGRYFATHLKKTDQEQSVHHQIQEVKK